MDRAAVVDSEERTPVWTRLVVACAGAVGIALMAQAATVSSATYDETAYLRIASDWWRTGRSSEMSRMGSPVTFFKLQAAPAFFVLDRIGLGGLIDRPVVDQASLLPIVRLSSLWIWIAAFGITVLWSRRIYGPRAMAFSACLFALSPNLLAHGSLITMEMPLIAATAALFFFFWKHLTAGPPRGAYFVTSAVVAGLAFSCKFTAVVYPPILGLIWAIDLWRGGERRVGRILRTAGPGMIGYLAIMLMADWAVTGFAVLQASARSGDHPSAPNLGWLLELPIPQDWAGFATQLRHQQNGGPSYLLGERRMAGWWYYYPVALAVKVPLACWFLIAARGVMGLRRVRHAGLFTSRPPQDGVRMPDPTRQWLLPLAIAAFVAIAMFASKRNYGVRYLLPMAPLAIVWISALAELRGSWRWIVAAGLIGQAAALVAIHPHELSYFNVLAGGKIGGRRVLADSNLDWGQGLKSLAQIQSRFQPLTLFYFGDVDPIHYGIEADCFLFRASEWPEALPRRFSHLRKYRNASKSMEYVGNPLLLDGFPVTPSNRFNTFASQLPSRFLVGTRFVAVSASLVDGPWGPEDYFAWLYTETPVAYTADGTIAIYDVSHKDRYLPDGYIIPTFAN